SPEGSYEVSWCAGSMQSNASPAPVQPSRGRRAVPETESGVGCPYLETARAELACRNDKPMHRLWHVDLCETEQGRGARSRAEAGADAREPVSWEPTVSHKSCGLTGEGEVVLARIRDQELPSLNIEHLKFVIQSSSADGL